MQVVVKFHTSAEPSYRAWLARLQAPPTGSAELAAVHVRALTDELVRTLGQPAGASEDESVRPSVWEWDFAADATVFYTVRDTSGGWLGPAVRTVLVTEVRLGRRG